MEKKTSPLKECVTTCHDLKRVQAFSLVVSLAAAGAQKGEDFKVQSHEADVWKKTARRREMKKKKKKKLPLKLPSKRDLDANGSQSFFRTATHTIALFF